MGSGSHRVQHRKHQEPGCCRRSTALTPVCSRAWRKRNYSIVSWKDAECSVMSSFLVPKTPFCGESGAREYALYFGIVCRGHPQSNPTNKICADIEFLLSNISGNRNYLSLVSIALTTQRKLGVASKGEFAFSENALAFSARMEVCAARTVYSCFPHQLQLCSERGKDRTSEHPEPWGCEIGQEIILFCRNNN